MITICTKYWHGRVRYREVLCVFQLYFLSHEVLEEVFSNSNRVSCRW